jgi:protein-S-isoprenylcysteine O-methyltransferase Ste14
MTKRRGSRVQSPGWYRRRSAVFAVVLAVGFFGGWAISVAVRGRYESAYTTIGLRWGTQGVLAAALAALVLILAAIGLRVWASSYLTASTAWDEEAHTEALIVAGPFRFVRHPLYLGNMLLAIGLGAAAPVFGWIFIVVAYALFIRALIAYEEERLGARQGTALTEYRRHVPAILPRINPVQTGQTPPPPSLSQGLRTESFTIFVVAGIIGLFAFPRYGVLVLVVCYIIAVLVQRRIEASPS